MNKVPSWYYGAALASTATAGGLLVWQLSKVLYSVVRESDYEARRMVESVSAAIQSDSPDIKVPDDMVLEVEDQGIYSYGVLQVLFFRQTPSGPSDWEWGYDVDGPWYPTTDLAPGDSALLDPPNLIFLSRLQMESVARRKAAAVTAAVTGWVPPPLVADASRRDAAAAPEALCCPITGQVMLQPVVVPSGKTFEYESIRQWVSRHGTDPNTGRPMSLKDVHPNLVVRELVEAWLDGQEPLPSQPLPGPPPAAQQPPGLPPTAQQLPSLALTAQQFFSPGDATPAGTDGGSASEGEAAEPGTGSLVFEVAAPGVSASVSEEGGVVGGDGVGRQAAREAHGSRHGDKSGVCGAAAAGAGGFGSGSGGAGGGGGCGAGSKSGGGGAAMPGGGGSGSFAANGAVC